MRASPFVVAFVFIAGFVFGCSNDVNDTQAFREDVIACEEAVAQIQSCCPNVAPADDACQHLHTLTYTDCGCDSGGPATDEHTVWPVLSIDASRAIAKTTCDAMVCPDMAAALARDHSSSSSTTCGAQDY